MTDVSILDLRKTYPGQAQPVLDHFSLSVHAGELVALLGPSGSGKSTILKLITGIETPDSGDIQFNRKTILNTPPNQRGAVFMFQKAYLFPFLSIAENIGFGLKMQNASKATIQAAVKRMLDLIGLPGIEKRKPAHLSGGEQQRVALARALVTQPRLLLLDEPLSSLDTAVRGSLQEAIRRIQRELGITTILVTHDLSEAMSMSDRMALLLDGQVAAFDQPMRLFQHPPSEQAARFVGINTFLRGEVSDGCLRTDLGTLEVCPNRSKPGPGVFAIRPEHIRIESNQRPNALPGIIKDCTYHGEYVEYQVEIPEMSVRARVPMPTEMVPHGAPVHVIFPQEHLFQIKNA